MSVVQNTIYLSLFAQIASLIISVYGLGIPIAATDVVLRSILGMETLVQFVEATFYTWFGVFSRDTSSKMDIAKFRYYDWFVTTPTMLLSTVMFFHYKNQRNIESFENEDGKTINPNSNPKTSKSTNKISYHSRITLETIMDDIKQTIQSVTQFTRRNWSSVSKMLLFNAMMLIMGYLQEIGVINIIASTLFGFLFFSGTFYIMYNDFAKYTDTNQIIYYIMLVLWGLYGIAALFKNKVKNSAYNILDIFSKNFYSVFIALYIYSISTM